MRRQHSFLKILSNEEVLKIEIYDLSLEIKKGLPTYPGDPVIELKPKVKFKDKGYNVTSVCFGTHSGTHVDAPLHLLDKGKQINELSLTLFYGEAIFCEILKEKNEKIMKEDFKNIDIKKGDILIVRTGWEKNAYKDNYFDDFPYFDPGLADYLIQKGIKALGADIPSVDGPGQNAKFHKKMLSCPIPLFEALVNLKDLVGQRLIFSALPLKINGADGSPVRAIAIKI